MLAKLMKQFAEEGEVTSRILGKRSQYIGVLCTHQLEMDKLLHMKSNLQVIQPDDCFYVHTNTTLNSSMLYTFKYARSLKVFHSQLKKNEGKLLERERERESTNVAIFFIGASGNSFLGGVFVLPIGNSTHSITHVVQLVGD